MPTGDETIKVLLIDDGKEWRGGQRQTLLLARGLEKRGIGITLACHPKGALAKAARKERLNHWEINIRGEWDAMAAWRLGNLCEEVDLLHTQTSHTHTIALLAVRIGTWRPVVVHRRVDFALSTGAFSRWKYRSADKYIAISRAVETALTKGGVNSKIIRLVHSGIDPSPIEAAPKIDLRKELGLPENTPLIGNVAQLVDHKGQRYLIEAMQELKKKVPDVHLAIAGDGPLKNELKNLAVNLNLKNRVHFLGYRTDIPSILGSFTVFVMPSHLEGMGTAVLDAFAARVPVVASDAGGIPEMMTNGVEGLLFEPKNPEALAASVARVIGNPVFAKKLTEAADKRLRNEFTADIMIDGVIKVYEELLA